MNPLYTITQARNIETVETWADEDEAEDNIYWYNSPGTAFD